MKHVVSILLGVVLACFAPAGWAQQDTGRVRALRDLQETFSLDAAQPTSSADLVTVQPGLGHGVVRAGGSSEDVVLLRVAAGWHVNAHRPRQDYLIGTSLDVAPQDGLHVAETRYPFPVLRTFGFAHDTLAVYEGEVPIAMTVGASDTVRPGIYVLKGTLRLQACNDQTCLRPATVEVPIPIRVQ